MECDTVGQGHVQSQSGLGVPVFKYWRLLYSPASPFFSTLLPVSNLNPSWTPSPYLKPQCHPSLELHICAFLHGLHSPRRWPRPADFFQWLQIGRCALLAQQLLQQVHAWDQGCHHSAEHTSPARWRWRGRRRWSAWRLAPPTSAIQQRRCHDIGWDIIKSGNDMQ